MLQSVIQFITEQRWEYPFPITSETKIEKDLKITGDDAVEFIIAFGKKFDVDVSNFMADEYFGPEGSDFLSPVIMLFTGKQAKRRKELRVADLERAIANKALV